MEIAKLCGTTSPNVTVHLKSMFARHGIPELVVSDNGPQFSAHTFAKFAEEYGFTHVTPSPKYPQANGQVERAVETVKGLLKKACDPYRALMAYRATPLESGLSPAELLMGRKIRTTVPTVPSQLQPSWPYLDEFKEKDSALKARQKDNFEKGHCAKELPELDTGNSVWLPERQRRDKLLAAQEPPDHTLSRHLRASCVETGDIWVLCQYLWVWSVSLRMKTLRSNDPDPSHNPQ